MSVAQPLCPACQVAVAPAEPVCQRCGLLLPGGRRAGSIPAGQTLAGGRFTVLRPLGRGGMGALYLASDHSAFDRPVVIKALLDPAEPGEAHEARDRFLGEARMLARLKYPTIPQIFAHFQDGPHACIVMEYVEGRDLLQGLTRVDDDGAQHVGQPYPLADVLRWGADVCRMLEYLARQQPPIVHQDIKPANLVLDMHSDDLYLVDFGTVRSHRIGAARAAFGTPGYAPPEQYQGRGEPRSDVYALAATLYHLASDDDPGAQPFAFPRLGQLGALGAALRPALERDPQLRPDAAGLRQTLEQVIAAGAHPPLQPAPQPAPAPAQPIYGRAPLKAIDGSELHNAQELAGWCERNWDLAAEWLYTNLPGRVESMWGDASLARRLHDIADQYGRRDAGLDRALAVLDPQGYGASPPLLSADAQQLDFGVVSGRERRWLILRNSGRRYVEAVIKASGPLIVDMGELRLRPGAQGSVTVDADMGHYPQGQQVQHDLIVRVGGQPALSVPTRATAGVAPPLYAPGDSTTVYIVVMITLATIFIVGLLILAG